VAHALDRAGYSEITKTFYRFCLRILEWVTRLALPSGVLAEQVHPDTQRPRSGAPLTWNHAAYVTAVQEYLDKLRALNCCSECGAPLSGETAGRLGRGDLPSHHLIQDSPLPTAP
jgi:hypothetical protein